MFRHFIRLLLILSICVPALATAQEEYWEYTFRPGDSLWKIAKKYTTTVNNWAEIQRINRIRQSSNQRIAPGTRIVIPITMLKLQPAPAIVIALSGDVRLVRANGDEESPAIGTKLFNGDRVITESTQNIRIQFADASELQVLPNSEVVLDKLSHHSQSGMVDTRVRLNTGSVNTWVEKLHPDSHYEIKTPSAITAVRGTTYRVSADGSEVSRTEVIEGKVAVSANNTEKQVDYGYGIVAEIDVPLPDPVELLSAPAVSDNLSAEKTALHINWAPLTGAKNYRYQLASDNKFNQVIIDDATTENQLNIEDLAPGQYYLRVRGVDQFKLEGFDSSRGYEILEPPVRDNFYPKLFISIGLLLILL